MMHSGLFQILLFPLFVILVACANTAEYEGASALAGQSLQVGKAYAFEYGSAIRGLSLGHYRLLVVWVKGRKEGSLDVITVVSEQIKDESKLEAMNWNVECGSKTKQKKWDFDVKDEKKYTYLGEVKPSIAPKKIDSIAVEYVKAHKTYSILFNNCHHYVTELYDTIKSSEGKKMSRRSRRNLDTDNEMYLGKRDDFEFRLPVLSRSDLKYLHRLARHIGNLVARFVEDTESLLVQDYLDTSSSSWYEEVFTD